MWKKSIQPATSLLSYPSWGFRHHRQRWAIPRVPCLNSWPIASMIIREWFLFHQMWGWFCHELAGSWNTQTHRMVQRASALACSNQSAPSPPSPMLPFHLRLRLSPLGLESETDGLSMNTNPSQSYSASALTPDPRRRGITTWEQPVWNKPKDLGTQLPPGTIRLWSFTFLLA